MISVTPDERDRGASSCAILALAIAALSLSAACSREPTPAETSAPAAATEPAPAPVVEPAPVVVESTPEKPVVAEPQIPLGLVAGCRAPDFEAQDIEGKRFKLSDYRGKVVVLDFWGFW